MNATLSRRYLDLLPNANPTAVGYPGSVQNKSESDPEYPLRDCESDCENDGQFLGNGRPAPILSIYAIFGESVVPQSLRQAQGNRLVRT